jgi:tetratricopeptide (TPR) repeat protein
MPAPLRFAVVLALSVLLSLASRPAHAGEPAMKPEARAHLERGLAAYGEKDWPLAIREFRAGFAIDPRPDFLFAWAQSARLSGDCTAAIDLYQQFIATSPSPEQSDAAEKMTARCRETLAAEAPAKAPEPAPPQAEPPPRVPPPTAPRAERAWWKDGWGASFTALGVVGLGVGIGMYVAASSSDDAAAHASSYDEFALRKDQAASHRTVAAIGLGVGGALLVTGGVRYLLVHRQHREASSTSVAFSLAPGAASLWVGGSF